MAFFVAFTTVAMFEYAIWNSLKLIPRQVTHICLDSCHTHIQNLRAQSVSLSVGLSLAAPSLFPHPSPYPCPKQSSQISSAVSANCFLIQRVWFSLQPTALETSSLPFQPLKCS